MSHDRSSARLDLHSEHFGRARLAGHILYFSSFPFVGLHAGRLGKHERFSPFHQGLTSPSLSRYKKAYGCPEGFCSSETFFLSALLLQLSDDSSSYARIMFSKATIFAAVLAACVGAVSAAPQEVWNPKITSPTTGTVWPAGSTQEVTW